jgi:hypothetical protein
MRETVRMLVAIMVLSTAGCGSLASLVPRNETMSGMLANIPDRGSTPVPWGVNYYFIGNIRVQPTRSVPESLLARLVGHEVVVTGKITGEEMVASKTAAKQE